LRVELRDAYVAALEQIRWAADVALAAAEASGGAALTDERRLYAENQAAWIEASPMTSAGLVDTGTFGARDKLQAASYETSVESYIDGLLQRLPQLNLTQAQTDDINSRVQVALRRAFSTVRADASGALDLREINNPRVVDKYQRLVAMLQSGIAAPTPTSLITDSPPTLQTPPNPVPNVTAQLASPRLLGRIDLSRVPPAEVDSVRFALAQIDRVVFPPTSTVVLRNAAWPLSIPIRNGTVVTNVRYELVFDAASNVRVERLGPDHATAVPAAFAALSTAAKINSLVTDFGLAGIVDRPAAPAQAAVGANPAVPPRPAAVWADAELSQIKSVFDRFAPADRAALKGVTLVRDHAGPALPNGRILEGFAHTAADPAHDSPGPPSVRPPHIHYYDAAFGMNQTNASGAPGAAGPGGDFVIAHEVGHMRSNQATLAGNAAIGAANTELAAAVRALNVLVRRTRLPVAAVAVWNVWRAANATRAVLTFNQSAIAGPPGAASGQALAAARTAIAARDAARNALTTAGIPVDLVAAATRLDAAEDGLLAASQLASAANDQIPIFVALATRFGFSKFTDYARQGGDPEWFAETFALFHTDPDRLNQMSRPLFLWFRAGMPQDRAWVPPP